MEQPRNQFQNDLNAFCLCDAFLALVVFNGMQTSLQEAAAFASLSNSACMRTTYHIL